MSEKMQCTVVQQLAKKANISEDQVENVLNALGFKDILNLSAERFTSSSIEDISVEGLRLSAKVAGLIVAR